MFQVRPPAPVSFNRIFVGHIPKRTTELQLRDAFGVTGFPVRNVELVLDRATGLPRGFAFAVLESRVNADCAEFSLGRLRTATVDGEPLDVQVVGTPRWWHEKTATP